MVSDCTNQNSQILPALPRQLDFDLRNTTDIPSRTIVIDYRHLTTIIEYRKSHQRAIGKHYLAEIRQRLSE